MSPFKSHKKPPPQLPINSVQQGFNNGYAKWLPDGPKAERVQVLGYVDAPGQDCYSRDIGRSFQLGGRTYYMFGDTFCNDAGISSNTVQVVPDPGRPQNAYYLGRDSKGLIPPLIDINSDEMEYLTYPGNGKKRIAFWCFGGVVEVTPGIGWTWYQKHIISSDGHDQLMGVGIARISHNKDGLNGELSCARMPDLMFDREQPLYGSFSTLVVDDMVYLWGQKGADVYLARVPKLNCQQLYKYEYWNGKEYVFEVDRATPVLQDFQQGQIFKSELFGPLLPWVFIGVTKWADSTVMIGAASRVEGPWDIRPLFNAQGIKRPDAYQYCMYPHPWGANQRNGRLLVSWCDPWPGGMIVAKVTFDADPRTYWATVSLDNCADYVACAAVTRAAEVCRTSNLQYAELPDPRRLYLRGIDEKAVELGLNMVRHQMGLASKEVAAQAPVGRRRGSSLSCFLAKVFGRGVAE
ncbi:MAG: hypothetical protein LQ338_001890 [Usnochroma carphineum]|nr:MAG: hypothetical protein LQ338_001890 [Usnochroma carphineum]